MRAAGAVVSGGLPARRGPSYMKAVFFAACFEVVAVAAMRLAQVFAPGGIVAWLAWSLHWPAWWAARELESPWLVAFFQLVLLSLPVYGLMLGWRRLTRGGPEVELPPLSPERTREHVEGVGASVDCRTPELCRARRGV